MLYKFGKLLLRMTAGLFFSKVHVDGLEKLNNGRPMMLCANHASAHLDGILIMVYSKREFYVLVRGDVFKKKWIAKLLSKIHLIPIYRMRDGFQNLDKNNETFDECFEILKNKGSIIIFPEASCFAERKLRKLHKGAAKIVLMAEERNNFQLGVQVATVGITQERLTSSGGRVFLQASDPFEVKDFVETYKENNNKGYTNLTSKIESELRTRLPIVENKEDEELFEQLIIHAGIRDDLSKWKKLAASINEADAELKEALTMALREFNQHLKANGTDIAMVKKLEKRPRIRRWAELGLYLVDLAALFPFFIVGMMFNYLPFYIPARAVKKIFKKDVEFRNSTHLAGTAFLFLFAYIFYTIILMFVINNPISLVVTLLIIAACGIVSYYYRKRFFDFIKALRYEMAGNRKRSEWRSQYAVLAGEFRQWIQN